MKLLSEILNETKPNVSTGVHGSFMTDTTITQTILPMVDQASYDKLKQVTMELINQIESSQYGIYNYFECLERGYIVVKDPYHSVINEVEIKLNGAIENAKNILENK